eukprot:XP_011683729.1 PREDICTED: BTB/POZ domain-containing protein KCTD17-like [Strongylocentrotus purpuratus]
MRAIAKTNEAPGNYIGLNVGGKIYRTSLHTTLTRYPGSFFDGLRGGGLPSKKDDQGNYLIDRDGDIFRHVLNFLRCGKLVVPARFDEIHLHLLEQEADFFMLDELKTAVKDKLALTRSAIYDFIGLNVGGKIYHTSMSVFRRYGGDFCYRLCDGVYPFPLDDQGNYMIDRDGEIFQHVLDFMTSGKLELPESFDELTLLEQEADFFKLEPLKEAIKERLEMVGFVINNQVFKLKQKDVLRYKKSLLTTYPKDTQGNYVIEWDMEAIDHVMSYIRYGGIVKDITVDQLRLLRRDAEKLHLHNAVHHCQEVKRSQNYTRPTVLSA